MEKGEEAKAKPSSPSEEHAFLESARKIVKTSIDLIRLAAYPDAKWNAQSIANALSWLDKAETWTRDARLRDKLGKVIQELTALLPSGQFFEFEQLVTAKDIFVKTLLLRPCSHHKFAEMVEILASATSSGSRAGKEKGGGDRMKEDSLDYYASQVTCLNSQLQLVSLLLEQRREQTVRQRTGSRSIENALREGDENEEEEEVVVVRELEPKPVAYDGGGGLESGRVSWSVFLEYLLSWRVVCLCAFLRLNVIQRHCEKERERILKIVFAHLKGTASQSTPKIDGVECCCILLLSHVWFDIIQSANNRTFSVERASTTTSKIRRTCAENGRGHLPEALERLVMQKLMEAFSEERDGEEEKKKKKRQFAETHPGLLATLACEYRREFLPVYGQWVDNLHEWSGEKAEHQRWLALAQSNAAHRM